MMIKIGYSSVKWKSGVKSALFWNTKKVPHTLISGITGGGKTMLSQMIVNQILNTKANNISICDFKAGGDWDNILPNHLYGEYTDCDRIFNNYYNDFVDTIKSKGHKEKYLVFDEFSSYALSKDSKDFKELMSKISHIAFMGRSFGYHLLLISQQFNSKVIDTAIREQFGIKIYMGSKISTESSAMLFPNCDINKNVALPSCCGYISMPENDLSIIQIPFINQPERLKKLLIKKGHANF